VRAREKGLTATSLIAAARRRAELLLLQ